VARVSALESVVLVLDFTEVVVQMVEGHLHEVLLKALCFGFLCRARFDVCREPRVTVRFRFGTRGSGVQFIVFAFVESPRAQRHFYRVRALITVWEPLSIDTNPGLCIIVNFLDNLFGAVHEFMGHLELQLDVVVLVADSPASITFTIDDGGDEDVVLELVQVDCELVV
jgi:hypothetical protein